MIAMIGIGFDDTMLYPVSGLMSWCCIPWLVLNDTMLFPVSGWLTWCCIPCLVLLWLAWWCFPCRFDMMLFPMSGLAWCCIPCPGIIFYPLCGLLCLCVYVASLHSIIMRITHALFPCSALADTTLLAGLTPGPSHWFYCVTFGDLRDFDTA